VQPDRPPFRILEVPVERAAASEAATGPVLVRSA
jgi:hypothetical protein